MGDGLMRKNMLFISLLTLLLLTGCTQEVEDKEVIITLNNDEIDGFFTGNIIDGVISGEGEFKASEDEGGWLYSGSFKKMPFQEMED